MADGAPFEFQAQIAVGWAQFEQRSLQCPGLFVKRGRSYMALPKFGSLHPYQTTSAAQILKQIDLSGSGISVDASPLAGLKITWRTSFSL
jgi:hypothetical protein